MPKNAARQRANQLAWMKRRRQEWLDANGPCAQCGSSHRLEVDHIDPETKVTHTVWSWAKPRRDAELAKCQVLCHACHAEKTRAENSIRARERGWLPPNRSGKRTADRSRLKRAGAERSRSYWLQKSKERGL
jgi:hypothetical protein